MKFLFLLLICLISSYTYTQQLNTGIISDNFVNSNIATYNPSSIVDSKTKFAFTSNSCYSSTSNFFAKNYLIYSAFTGGFIDGTKGKFIEHKKAGYRNSDFTLDLLNFKYEINHENALAYAFRIRNFSSKIGLPSIWAEKSVMNYVGGSLNTPESMAGFSFNEFTFTEHVFTYARTIFDRKESLLKAGLSFKLLNGLNGDYFYVNSGNITFTSQNDGLAQMTNLDADFGRNYDSGQLLYRNRGFGFDLGATYEIRPDYEKQYYAMDGKSKNVRYDINKYKWKFAASITDIGSIRFIKDSSTYNFSNPSVLTNGSSFYKNDFAVSSPFGNVQNVLQSSGVKSATDNFEYRMNLPTTLHVSADYFFKKNMYVSYNASIPLSLPNDKTKVKYIFIQTITPRIEKTNYSFMLPLSFQGNGKFYVGLAGRMNINKITVFAGSNNVAFMFGQKSSLTRNIFVGVSINMLYKMPSDIDMDRISDEKDACPDDYGLIEFQGCPDTDGDEIPDKKDFCIYDKGPANTHGCPDSDGDGIIDMNDMCPNVPGLGVHYGCPDKDFDGVIDMVDQCPDVPGIELNNGCPFENPGCCMDNDGDGVSNNADKCPDHAGSVYNNGCPIDSLNINKINLKDQKTKYDPNNTGEQIKILKNNDTIRNFITTKEELRKLFASQNIVKEHVVHFNVDQATLTEDEIRMFDQFFIQIANNPQLSLMVVGNTDKDGSLDYNLILSKKRAETVKRKLIEYGFPADKIVLYYFGEEKSLHKGSYTAEQKRQDRRVEIKVIQGN